MTFNRYAASIVLCAALLSLAGCPGQDENSIADTGRTIHIAEAHLEEQLPTTPKAVGQLNAPKTTSAPELGAAAAVANSVAALATPGGYDQSNLEHHDILDKNSRLLSIYRAYVVLDDFRLVRCTSVSQLPRMLFNSIFPAAFAHAGHGSEPVGGRGLDKPNVIDIVTQDEYVLALGDLSVAPGQYCGIRVSLARSTNNAYGKPDAAPASSDDPTTTPEVPNLAGKMFALRADYCSTPDRSGGCLGRSKVDIDDSGLTLPAALTMSFAQPLEVSATGNGAYVAVGIAYGEWLRDVDVELLTSDTNERQKLIANIAGSVHVYSKGLGDLPANVALP